MKRRITKMIVPIKQDKVVALVQVGEKQTTTEIMNDIRRYLKTEFPETTFKIMTTANHHVYLYSEPYNEEFVRHVADMLRGQYSHLPGYKVGVGRL